MASTVAVGLALLAVRTALSSSSAGHLLRDWGYWSILTTVIIAVTTMVKTRTLCKQEMLSWAKQHWRYIIGYIILMAIVASLEPLRFKVIFDEHVYAGDARNMHRYQSATHSVRQHAIWGSIDDVDQNERQVDFRPTLYPFCVHIAHKLTGYRPENSFYTNILIGLLLLITLHAIFVRLISPPLAATLIVFLGTLPLWVQNATGGGYDMLNLFLIACLFLQGVRYLESKTTPSELPLVAIVLLLANVRYESIVYLAIIPYIIWLRWHRTTELKLHWPAPPLLILLALPVLINVYYAKNPDLFTSPFEGVPFMGTQFIAQNLPAAVFYLFQPTQFSSNSIIYSITGIIALVICLVHGGRNFLQRKPQSPYEQTFYAMVAIILALNMLYMTLFWGEWTDLVVARFSLPLHLLLLLGLAATLNGLKISPRLGKFILIGVCLYACSFRLPVLARHDYTNGLAPAMESEWLERKMKHYDTWGTLVLSENSLLMTLCGYPAAPNQSLNTRLWQIERCLNVPYYQHILITEQLSYQGGAQRWKSQLDYDLNSYFELRLLGNYHATPLRDYRLYELVAVRPHTQKAPDGFKGTNYNTPIEMLRDQELSMP
jgi:hypothetical protein